MSLFAPLAALTWQHFQPQVPDLPTQQITRGHLWLLENFNAGGEQHGMLAWTLGALLPATLFGLLAATLSSGLELLGWAFEVLVLYFLFSFRRSSYVAASIARALSAGDLANARSRLSQWSPGLLPSECAEDLVRQTLEEIIKTALTALFGILFWYWAAAGISGITGAVLYVLSHACRDQWQSETAFARFSQQVVYLMDWLPARALGFSFAIVGNFQDATECWRDQARHWRDDNEGVILAAGAGALGIRLGGALHLGGNTVPRHELGMDELPAADSIDAAVALIWRAALLWLSVVGMFWLGGL